MKPLFAQIALRCWTQPRAPAGLALLAAAALCATPRAWAGNDETTQRLQQATLKLRALHAQPSKAEEPSPALEAAEAAWAQALRAQLLASVAQLEWAGWENWPSQLQSARQSAQPWSDIGGSATADNAGALPPWLLEALAAQLTKLNAAAPAREPYRPSAVLTGKSWPGAPAGMSLWSGPAVRDGVASYQTEGGNTRIRVQIGQLPDFWALARSKGLATRLTLDASDADLGWYSSLWPIRLELRWPLWLVTPQELVAATLVQVRSAPQCEDNYAEFLIAGERQPPVWAVLALPDAVSAKTSRIRRVPALPADKEGGADSVSRLELSWADPRIAPLHLVAKRFGDILGTYATLAQAASADRPERLSSAGSPECAPR